MGDEFLALEKLFTVLFGADTLKITTKRHMACYMCQNYRP